MQSFNVVSAPIDVFSKTWVTGLTDEDNVDPDQSHNCYSTVLLSWLACKCLGTMKW